MRNVIIILLLMVSAFSVSCGREISDLESDLKPVTVSPINDVKAYEFNGETNGCGDFMVYRATQDKKQVIVVKLDKKSLKISERPQKFEIGKTETLEVYIENFGNSTYENRQGYCFDDIAANETPPMRINAANGTVNVNSIEGQNGTYNVNVFLERLVFKGENAAFVFEIPKVEILNAKAGWLPG